MIIYLSESNQIEPLKLIGNKGRPSLLTGACPVARHSFQLRRQIEIEV